MKFNLDIIPKNLDETVDIIIKSIENVKEKEKFKDPVGLHFQFGMYLRNNWSLWQKETVLVQWFIKNLGIVHADDISSTILEAVAARLRGEEFNPQEHVEHYKKYWQTNGIDAATMKKL